MVKDVDKLRIKRSQWMIECPNCYGQGEMADDFFGHINCVHCDGEGWLFGESEEEVLELAADVIEHL